MAPEADIFSLGVVIYEMYRFNLFLAANGKANLNLVSVQHNAVPMHQIALENSVYQLDTSCLPFSMANLMKRILMVHDGRANAIEIINNPAFQTGTILCLSLFLSFSHIHTNRYYGCFASH